MKQFMKDTIKLFMVYISCFEIISSSILLVDDLTLVRKLFYFIMYCRINEFNTFKKILLSIIMKKEI